jgi:transposase-like protein
MSEQKRGRWSKNEKFRIALEAVRNEKTIAQIAEENKVHPNQVSEWKKQLLEHGEDIFSAIAEKQEKNSEKDHDELLKTIGSQTVAIEWLKKRLGFEDIRSVLK